MFWSSYKYLFSGLLLLSLNLLGTAQTLAPQTAAGLATVTTPAVLSFQPLTTHPEADMAGVISPDGFWLAFASKRSGNFDIWIKPVAGGMAYQITEHKADDYNPCWSPDGKKIIFTSLREDAAGDIWLINLSTRTNSLLSRGKPKKITTYLGLDDFPKFSPEGDYLAFVSDRDGQENIWAIHLKKKRFQQITSRGGTQPAWSNDGRWLAFTSFRQQNPAASHLYIIPFQPENSQPSHAETSIAVTSGKVWDGFPCWSPRNYEIVFSRIGIDLNYDGILTPADPASIWKTDVTEIIKQHSQPPDSLKFDFHSPPSSAREFQVTPWGSNQAIPFWDRQNFIAFTAHLNDNHDIYKVPLEDYIRKTNSAQEQLAYARELFPFPAPGEKFSATQTKAEFSARQELTRLRPRDLFIRLLALQRVIDYFPAERDAAAWAYYEMGRTFLELNFPALGTRHFNEAMSEFSHNREAAAFAEIARVVSRSIELGNYFEEQDLRTIQTNLELYEQLFQKYQALPQVAVRVKMIIADLLVELGEKVRALQVFQQIIEQYSAFPSACAEAQMKIGTLFTEFYQTETVNQAYLKVINSYPTEKKWVSQALDKIFAFEQTITDSSDLIRDYHEIALTYEHISILAATAHYKIGKTLFALGDNSNALDELTLILEKYPDSTDIVALARLLMAHIYFSQGEDFKSIENYQTIIQDYAAVENGYYARLAEERLMKILLESGERLWKLKEYTLALSRFRRATVVQPDNILAHRGVIKCLFSMRQIDKAVETYQTALNQSPDNEILRYSLGLCYSYKAEGYSKKEFSIDYLHQSNTLIEQALAENYRLLPAYLTLSVNYEMIERYETNQRQKRRSWGIRLLNSIAAPFVTTFRWVFRIQEKRPEHWFEKAIDVLTTAIALNDEKQDPDTEAQLALNLAINYYNLEEYGFELAYKYFRYKQKLDPTFQSKEIAAFIYTRIGHCALVVEDFENGPGYLEKAIQLNRELGRTPQVVGNMKRLALLYQLKGDYLNSIHYFEQAAEFQANRTDLSPQIKNAELATMYRQIAINYNILKDEEEIERYTEKALHHLSADSVQKVKSRANWLKIGLLGWEIPVYNAGKLVTGQSTAYEGFTTPEEFALIYSIRENSATRQQEYEQAIRQHLKKLRIYQQLDNPRAVATFLNNIGYLYYLSNEFPAAWRYFQQSLKICHEEELYNGALTNIFNLTTLTVELNQPQMAEKMRALRQQLPPDEQDFGSIEAGMKFINQGLRYYRDEDVLLDPKYRIILFNIMGNLHVAKATQATAADSLPFCQRPQDWLFLLEEMMLADSCYKMALRVAPVEEYPTEISLVHLNRGLTAYSLGELEQSYSQLQQSRTIASQYSLTKLLWRIDHILARLLQEIGPTGRAQLNLVETPEIYFDEALEIIQSNVLVNQIGSVPGFQNRIIRRLYEDAIAYYFALGESERALYLTESLRSQLFLRLLTGKRPVLKSESDKNQWSFALSYQQDIQELEDKIRKLQFSPRQSDLMEQEDKLSAVKTQYQAFLQEVRQKQPELQALIRVNPPAYQSVQRVLPDTNVAIVNYLVTAQTLYIWVLTSNDIYPLTVKVNREVLVQFSQELLHLSERGAANDGLTAVSNRLNQFLLLPLWDLIENKTEIIVVPDDCLHLLPFGWLFYVADEYQLQKVVTVSPSLSDYYYCFQRRKLSGGKILFGAVEPNLIKSVRQSGYDTENLFDAPTGQADFRKKMSQANILHMAIHSDWKALDPALSQFRSQDSSAQRFDFSGLNILNWPLKTNLIILENRSAVSGLNPTALPFTYLQQALFYSGTPSLIYSLWPAEPKMNQELFTYFYEYLTEYKPAVALLKAQQQVQQKYPHTNHWASIQFYGFVGMTQAEEVEFATQSFEKRMKMGASAYEEGEWEETISYLEDALQMARARNDQASILKIYQHIIETAFLGKFFEKAIEYQEKILELALAQNKLSVIAESYFNLMIFHAENQQPEQARFFQQKYAALAQEHNLLEQAGDSYLKLGVIFEKLGDYAKALENFQTALQLYQQVKNPLKIAEALLAGGRLHLMHFRDYVAALTAQTQALALFQEEGDDQNTILALRSIGLTYEYLANYREAEKFQRQALELAEATEDPLNSGICRYNLANIFWKTGFYQKSLQHLREATTLFQQLQNTQLNAVALSTEGLVLMTLGQLEEALRAEEKARELAASIQDQPNLATIYKNIGLIYTRQQEWGPALHNFKAAQQIDSTRQDLKGLADSYRFMGNVNFQLGQLRTAQRYYRRSLRYAREINDQRATTYSRYGLAQMFYGLNQIDSARVYLEDVIQQAAFLGLVDIDWRANRFMGQIWWQAGDLPTALEYLKKAESIIETMRTRILVEDYKAGFIDDKLDVYHDLVSILLAMNQTQQAFEMAERAKSRNFVELLANRDLDLTSVADPQLAQAKDSLSHQISELQGSVTALRLKGKELTVPEQAQLTKLESRLEQAKNDYQQLTRQLQEQNPELADLVSVNPKAAEEIMTLLPDSVGLIEYYLSREAIFIWILNAGELKAEVVKFPVDSLGRLVIAFRQQMTAERSIDKFARQLYQLLLQPVADDFAGLRHLIIIPHGFLHYLPFAALLVDDANYLIDKYSLSLVPSGTVLTYCLEKGNRFREQPGEQNHILALGNPDLGDPVFNLEFAEHEIRSLTRTYPNDVEAYTGQHATETNFRQRCQEADLILFSCHGEYDVKNPLFSALLLTPDAQNNGRLEAHEIFGLRLNTRLIVMSACETGLGTLTGGDEVIGLSRSFMYAGTASIMASLWKVSDLATAVLVKRFFRYLKEDQNRSVALRKAQLLVRQEIHAHPAYWAAFNIIGDYR